MTLAIDFFGERYDDAIPSFVIITDKLCWHRPGMKMLDYPSLQAAMTAEGYTPGANEVGTAETWAMENLGMSTDYEDGGETTAPLTAVASLGASTVTISGGPADAAYTITVTYQVDTSGSDVDVVYAAAEGETAEEAATGLAAEFSGDLTATAAAGVVTIALGTATTLDALSVAVT